MSAAPRLEEKPKGARLRVLSVRTLSPVQFGASQYSNFTADPKAQASTSTYSATLELHPAGVLVQSKGVLDLIPWVRIDRARVEWAE